MLRAVDVAKIFVAVALGIGVAVSTSRENACRETVVIMIRERKEKNVCSRVLFVATVS